MNEYQVTVIRDDGKEITVNNVNAKDNWSARTNVWFSMPKMWADGHGVDYKVIGNINNQEAI